MDIDEAKEHATRLLKHSLAEFISEPLSETDTRCKIVDALLMGPLQWQEHSIRREVNIEDAGYVDYLLHTSKPAFAIEAKKNTVQFSLPSTRTTRSFKIGGVLTEDEELQKAIHQCRRYAIGNGIAFCCVTNGTQYIFFRSQNEEGIPFSDHRALVFTSVDDILSNFSAFFEVLSFPAVSEGRNFSKLPVAEVIDTSSKFKELSTSTQRSKHKIRNRLYPFVRDVVAEVFQDLADEGADHELIEQCYVESAKQETYEQSLRALVRSRPKLADGDIKPLKVTRRNAGEFEGVLQSSSPRAKTKEVVMLLGGIGAGKTTFIRRFRKVIAKERIDNECLWVEVNFNRYSDAPGELERWVSATATAEIEKDYPSLEFGSFKHLKQAYHLEYERLRRGRLAPLFEKDPTSFEIAFSDEVARLETQPIQHLVRLLSSIQSSFGRRVFLIFDNADQFSDVVQNDVFMLAHRIAQDVGCTLIVSLREESYWKNKNYGALSAFHALSFYVEAPDVMAVISKRFNYATELLSNRGEYVVPSSGMGVTQDEALKVFQSIRETVLGDRAFADFLRELSPGEVRRPLGELATFLFSGHTNIDSVLRGFRIHQPVKIGFHEFAKSVALGDREYFNEQKSDLINLFSLDGGNDASNVNRLAVMGYIHTFRREKSEAGLGYVPIAQLLDLCAENGVSRDTVRGVVQFLNSRRVLEVDQQGRESLGFSRFVRTTRSFDYYLTTLGKMFVYVDLVLPKTAVSVGTSFEMIERLSSQIYAVGAGGIPRLEKLELRVERAQLFARYIADCAAQHSMFRKVGLVDPLVTNYVDLLEQGLGRQADSILRNAREAFSPRSR